jgi:putative transposase
MSHRVLEIAWLPHSPKAWGIFTAARLEAAKLWADLVTRHHRLRRLGWKWPDAARWFRWARGKYPNLSAQSAQQTLQAFLEAVRSTSALRKKGHPEARYPWRKPRYVDVTYTNQDAKIRNGFLLLPHGRKGKGTLAIKIPKGLTLPGKLMEVTLEYGCARLVCQVEDEKLVEGQAVDDLVVGVDLGVNTLLAATDGQKAVLVSGREVKATIQYRNKRLAQISTLQAGKTKGSKRYKRLQRRKYAMLDKTRRKVRDLCHKATRKIVRAFPGAKMVVGQPFNEAAKKVGRRQAQMVSQACTGKLIQMLDYKAKGTIVVPEPYSSQTCPVCGGRQVCRRKYKCKGCGFEAPRDVVGALNIRQIGMRGGLSPTPGQVTPKVIFVHPSKYPGSRQVVPAEPRQVAQGV